MSEAVSAGLQFRGPALFSVFSGSTASFPNLAPYLVSASAAQSRAFPCFVYDPGAGEDEAADKVPYLLMVDAENILHRVVVTHNIISAARRCAQAWRSLQELAGIGNSYALALLERERQAWGGEKKRGREG